MPVCSHSAGSSGYSPAIGDTFLEAEAVLEVWPELVAVTVTVSVVRFVPILLWEMIFPDKLNLLFPFPVRVIVVVPATLLV